LPEASRLEDELKGKFPTANIKFTKSSAGDFRVLIDGKNVFDKLNVEFRFPNENEISERILNKT
jgi:selT/selW/selH-like putative selenoprotein